jgi:UDP-N-acetylglucosamine/UDP-N-acetylgalactosamine 4-epimerase
MPHMRTVRAVHRAPRRGDLPRSLASIAKAERLLGYEPQFRLHDGLAQTIAWYAENVVPRPAGEAAKVVHA